MAKSEHDKLQKLIDGAWKFASAARAACVSKEAWRSFQHVQQPPPTWALPWDRFAYGRCADYAVSLLGEPQEESLELIPVWFGDNRCETPAMRWFKGHVVLNRQGDVSLLESGDGDGEAQPAVDQIMTVLLRTTSAANVVQTRYYAPSVLMEMRFWRYGVLRIHPKTVLAVLRVASSASLPYPSGVIPPFSSLVEPRVDGLSREMLAALKGLELNPGV